MNWIIDLFQNIVFQTVISGVLIFVIGQIILKFFIEPIQKYKGVVGKIDNKLKFYSNVIASPGVLPQDIISECSRDLRNLSCELEEAYKQIPPAPFLRKPQKLISDSAGNLIYLSNSIFRRDSDKIDITSQNYEARKQIRANLNIPEL